MNNKYLKNTKLYTTILVLSFLHYACDSEKQPAYTQAPEPMDISITIGNMDACEYYETNTSLYPKNNFRGEYTTIDLVDINNDNVFDFEIIRSQLLDTSLNYQKYSQEIILHTYNNTELFIERDNNYNNYPIPFNINDTINTQGMMHEKIGHGGTITKITSFKDSTGLRQDTCCGLWTDWNTDKYFGFIRTYPDTLIGWVRMELVTEGNLIKIKDCGIKRKGVEYQ